MTSASTAGSGIQEEILATVRMSQDVIVEALQTWSASIQSLGLQLPRLSLPFSGLLPSPDALVAGVYDFAGQLLAAQRDFARDLIQVAAPLAGHGDA